MNDVWCLDLFYDATTSRATVRFLMIVDEYSHWCLDIVASRRLEADEVTAALMQLIKLHGRPRHLRRDAGGEFIAGDLQRWLSKAGIQIQFIDPGSPRTERRQRER